MTRDTTPDGGFTIGGADQTRLVVAASYTDPKTGMVFVHKDLELFMPDWTREAHIAPTQVTESFGDVESWTTYVLRYVDEGSLLTWNSQGLRAVLDYPLDIDVPARRGWVAQHPFALSAEWRAWTAFASGQALSQRQAIEKLEDLADDIADPPQADLMLLLRSLRAGATAKAETEIRPDGTQSVTFSKDTNVSSRTGDVTLPSLITVAIPVLAGDAAKLGFRVRLRVSVDDNAKLTFRFSIQNAERILETAFATRVDAAKGLLGEERTLLRAAG